MSELSLSNDWKKYMRLRGIRTTAEKFIFSSYTLISGHSVDREKHSVTISECTYSPWNFDKEFMAAHQAVYQHTLVDKCKLYHLWHYMKQVKNFEGDVIEVGAWRGGSGCLLAMQLNKHSPTAKTYICDTFEGMPVVTHKEDNFYRGGELADTSAAHVQTIAKSFGLNNVEVLKGIFPLETAHKVTSTKFKFVHIDVDIYQSAKDTVDWVWDKLVPGGMIVFDDYGYSATEGVTRFVNEFTADNINCLFIFNQAGHAILVKR